MNDPNDHDPFNEPERAHARARELMLEPFFWDCTNEWAPFGSDEGWYRYGLWSLPALALVGVLASITIVPRIESSRDREQGWEQAEMDWEGHEAVLFSGPIYDFSNCNNMVVKEGHPEAEERSPCVSLSDPQQLDGKRKTMRGFCK